MARAGYAIFDADAPWGEDTLMFATDSPHSESWFPESVEIVLEGGSILASAKRQLFWENAVHCYRRYGTGVPQSTAAQAVAS